MYLYFGPGVSPGFRPTSSLLEELLCEFFLLSSEGLFDSPEGPFDFESSVEFFDLASSKGDAGTVDSLLPFDSSIGAAGAKEPEDELGAELDDSLLEPEVSGFAPGASSFEPEPEPEVLGFSLLLGFFCFRYSISDTARSATKICTYTVCIECVFFSFYSYRSSGYHFTV